MRHDEHMVLRRQGRLDGGKRRSYASIAGHDAILHRNVQILANQHPFSGEIQAGHFFNFHFRGPRPFRRRYALDHASVVSSIRLEKPHSLSYQAQTLTSVPWMTLVSVAS